jgi:hypothetical protein
VIVWLNGPFGVDKATTATELAPLLDKFRIFDPAIVGNMLREYLGLTSRWRTTFRTGRLGGRWS